MPTRLSGRLIVISQSAVETKPVCIRLESHGVKKTARQGRKKKRLSSHFGHQGYDFMFTALMHYLFLALHIINIYTVIIISISMPLLLCLQPASVASQ